MIQDLTYLKIAPSEIERMNFTYLSFWTKQHKIIHEQINKARNNG